MLKSALRFSSYLDGLLGAVDWEALKSEAFTYLVPNSSLITPTGVRGLRRQAGSHV